MQAADDVMEGGIGSPQPQPGQAKDEEMTLLIGKGRPGMAEMQKRSFQFAGFEQPTSGGVVLDGRLCLFHQEQRWLALSDLPFWEVLDKVLAMPWP